jgi:PHD/YefM family antitoxin component YafN of YafNO toxin-antitoxin module
MTVRLPDELRTVVVAHPGVPLELVDEQTHESYVLLPADEFQRLKTALEDDLNDTYPAQVESAMRAGWDDPRMDEYNDYDTYRGQG